MPNEGGFLLLTRSEADEAIECHGVARKFIRPFVGSQEFIKGQERRCVWVTDKGYQEAEANAWLGNRFEAVRKQRASSNRATTKQLANTPYRFGEVRQTGRERTIVVPRVSSENRDFLPVGLGAPGTVIGDRNFALYDAPIWNMSLIASRLHWVWIGTVCVRMRTDFSYSNTLGWNTFPVPKLTEKNKEDMTRRAKDILLAREAHFPATIANLVESRRGAVAWALWASLRFLSPLIKPDVRISRIRLPDRLHLKAHGGGPRWTRLCRITPSSPNTTVSGKPGATRRHLMAPDQEMTYSLVRSSSLIPDNQFESPAPPSP